MCPGILVQSHGPFAWGLNHEDGYKNAERLELIAELAFKSLLINKNIKMDKSLIKKHFFRKHGKDRYYDNNLKNFLRNYITGLNNELLNIDINKFKNIRFDN